MEHRILEINLHFAKDLSKVNLINKMDVYTVVSISGGGDRKQQKTKTPVDRHGDANPTWNFPMKFTIDESALQMNLLTLDFKLFSQRALGDKFVGEVHLQIAELLHYPGNPGADGKRFASFQVSKLSGKPKGELTFSFKFHEKAALGAPVYGTANPSEPPQGKIDIQPVAAYHAGASYDYRTPASYPSPPAAYGHLGPPPAAGYTYTPPPSSRGYPYAGPPPAGYGYAWLPPPQKNTFGLGLGAGLLGGLVIGNMFDDLIGG